MDKQQLFENIKRKKSFLCVGLDTDNQENPGTSVERRRSDLCIQQSNH